MSELNAYSISLSISDTFRRGGAPLSEDQKHLLVGCLSVWLDKYAETRPHPAEAEPSEEISMSVTDKYGDLRYVRDEKAEQPVKCIYCYANKVTAEKLASDLVVAVKECNRLKQQLSATHDERREELDKNRQRLEWCYMKAMSCLPKIIMTFDEWCEGIDSELSSKSPTSGDVN